MESIVLQSLREDLAELHVPDGLRNFAGIPAMQFAFFPGASGLWFGEEARFPVGGTLVLGSNFGSVDHHLDADGRLLRQDERQGRTWAPLMQMLQAAGIAAEECFFTNAWPLLHEGSSNCSGQIDRWLRDRALMLSSLRFFRRTLELMRPSMVVCLGIGPAAFCAQAWPVQLAAWSAASWRSVDRLPFAAVDYGLSKAVCVAITHTCRPNRKHRQTFTTQALETGLLCQARAQAVGLGCG